VTGHRGPLALRPAAGTTLAEAEFVWTRRQVLILLVLCVGHVLETIDITITNVALPAIKAGLGFTDADLSWVVNAYTVCFGGFLLLCSRAGDVWGHRRMLTSGLVLFGAASALAAAAPTPLVLVIARGSQGIAAALVAPMTLALLAAAFPEGRPRNSAVGIWAVVTTVSGSLAMLLGGLLTQGPGWRWVFWVNVPVALLVIAGGLRFLPANHRTLSRRQEFDVVGAVSVTAGVSLLVAATVGTHEAGWNSTRTLILFALAALILGLAVVHEARIARNPLLPRDLFRLPSVIGANLTQALCGGGIFVMFYVVTLYQQNVLAYTPLQTALAYLPHTVALVVAARLAPALISRLGAGRTVFVGSLAGALGLALLARVGEQGPFAGTVLLPSLILGAAIPLTLIPNTTVALAQVPHHLHGAAAGLVNVSRVLGGTVALALASALAAGLSDALVRTGVATSTALTHGYRLSFALGASLFMAAAAVGLIMIRRR
jgi:EmrB/QacA subfamily drug resistance transporter